MLMGGNCKFLINAIKSIDQHSCVRLTVKSTEITYCG